MPSKAEDRLLELDDEILQAERDRRSPADIQMLEEQRAELVREKEAKG